MAKIIWDNEESVINNGIDHVAVYYYDKTASKWKNPTPWNGVTAINVSYSGGDINTQYADNRKYIQIPGKEDMTFTVEAYTKPDGFEACDGSKTEYGVHVGQQTREPFAIVYRTKRHESSNGGAIETVLYEYTFMQGCKCKPAAKNYSTIQDNPEAITYSFECTPTPQKITYDISTNITTTTKNKVPCIKMRIPNEKLTAFEEKLYKTDMTGWDDLQDFWDKVKTIYDSNP